jgi:hypothetical protein
VEALAEHFFRCPDCTIGDSADEDRLCQIGRVLQHLATLHATDAYALEDYKRQPLSVPKVCQDCGNPITTLHELDTHDLICHGPVRLVHTPEGIYGEVWT